MMKDRVCLLEDNTKVIILGASSGESSIKVAMASFVLVDVTILRLRDTQRIRKPRRTTYSSSNSMDSSRHDEGKNINTILSSRPSLTSLLLISTHIFTSIHSIQTTSASQHQNPQQSTCLPLRLPPPRSRPTSTATALSCKWPTEPPERGKSRWTQALLSRHPEHKHSTRPTCLARPSPLAAVCSQLPPPSLSKPRSDLSVTAAARHRPWSTAPWADHPPLPSYDASSTDRTSTSSRRSTDNITTATPQHPQLLYSPWAHRPPSRRLRLSWSFSSPSRDLRGTGRFRTMTFTTVDNDTRSLFWMASWPRAVQDKEGWFWYFGKGEGDGMD